MGWVCVRALQIAFGVVRARAGCLQVTYLDWRRLEQLQGSTQPLSCQGADRCLVYGCSKQHVRYELILQPPTRGPWPLKAWPALQAGPALSPRAASLRTFGAPTCPSSCSSKRNSATRPSVEQASRVYPSGVQARSMAVCVKKRVLTQTARLSSVRQTETRLSWLPRAITSTACREQGAV